MSIEIDRDARPVNGLDARLDIVTPDRVLPFLGRGSHAVASFVSKLRFRSTPQR